MTRHTALALALGLSLMGCSKRQEVKPMAQAEIRATATPGADAADSLEHYTVKPGDCLWTIASRDEVLGDAFRWPLLYKQNRDQIADPDLIEPRQRLGYQSEYSRSEIDEAVKVAEERLPYKRKPAPKY
jgi:hypothetical protein